MKIGWIGRAVWITALALLWACAVQRLALDMMENPCRPGSDCYRLSGMDVALMLAGASVLWCVAILAVMSARPLRAVILGLALSAPVLMPVLAASLAITLPVLLWLWSLLWGRENGLHWRDVLMMSLPVLFLLIPFVALYIVMAGMFGNPFTGFARYWLATLVLAAPAGHLLLHVALAGDSTAEAGSIFTACLAKMRSARCMYLFPGLSLVPIFSVSDMQYAHHHIWVFIPMSMGAATAFGCVFFRVQDGWNEQGAT
ncbi:MAG: hypothetical protein Alpg2KO_10820 [Alphaproteobacteria bacterium]